MRLIPGLRHILREKAHQIIDSLTGAKLIEFQSTVFVRYHMKFTNIIAIAMLFAVGSFAQKPDDILATATGHTFRVRDLSEDTRKTITEVPTRLTKGRTDLLGQMLNQRAINIEAKSLSKTPGKLIAAEKAKAPNPTEEQIKAVYDANRTVVGDRTLEQVRKQIVSMLRSDPEQKLLVAYFAQLSTKYKVIKGKDINATGLAPTDGVGTVNGQPVTAKDFDEYAKFQMYNARIELADLILDDLNDMIYDALVADEAKAANIDSSTLIANEVTNKMKDYTDEERVALEGALSKRLFAKYQVKILYKEPDPMVQNISVGTSPTNGPATATVTIIMFSDFQCSACSATHPILKKVMADYAARIRFVVRDFPLETIHENAWRAALAAGAANAQGKFFEYTEILYKNQDKLDVESLKKYAAQTGLNAAQFELDFNSEKIAAGVRKDMADGESYGISSTPSIFVNGVLVRNLSVDGFKAAIERALKK